MAAEFPMSPKSPWIAPDALVVHETIPVRTPAPRSSPEAPVVHAESPTRRHERVADADVVASESPTI